MYFVEVKLMSFNNRERFRDVMININEISSIRAKDNLDNNGYASKTSYYIHMNNGDTHEVDEQSFYKVKNILTK